ncbi:3-ketoacyl-ACP reductase [Actinocatenispora thailandica]|uniref:3-ketoacyl-ACP reductase n=1 Tax=Actinocatenispora thailandica TaxID=227318 RepID=A0A7R7DJ90_9ACTN|nr:SDR family oxidoreductase [Actinocatenispora thailandica]BCJ32561.1 3-ketoacyl-ACP reductase [Actinocatenispora thailandica]
MVESTRRVALVTGVSRTNGIAAAVAHRLAADGYDLFLSGLPGYDATEYGTEDRTTEVITALRDAGAAVGYRPGDFADPAEPAALVDAAIARYGRIDALAAVHAYSTHTPLAEITAEEIDRHLSVNTRGSLLLVKHFAAAYRQQVELGGPGGRVVLFSSGQRLGPMPDELAYIASKGAIEALTLSLSASVAGQGITVNAINPGPCDTGYASGEVYERVAAAFPTGRWGTPADVAPVVGWLCSAEAGWITGQVIDVEGGFRRG